MGSLLENNFIRLRLRQLDEAYPEPSVFGDCDCTSYSYFIVSILLLSLGVYITVSALGATDHSVFSNLGHMWLIGPFSISCGTMFAIKSILYLRRKSLIKMLLRQRALLRGLQELTQQPLGQEISTTYLSASTLTLPPAYDLIVPSSDILSHCTEIPPPSYAEAMLLISHEKTSAQAAQSNVDPESGGAKGTSRCDNK